MSDWALFPSTWALGVFSSGSSKHNEVLQRSLDVTPKIAEKS